MYGTACACIGSEQSVGGETSVVVDRWRGQAGSEKRVSFELDRYAHSSYRHTLMGPSDGRADGRCS